MTDTRNRRTAERLTKVGSCLVHWTIAAVLATVIAIIVTTLAVITGGSGCK